MQFNKNKILSKRSDVAGHVPSLNSLSAGEIVVNTADGIIFLKKIINSNEYVVKFLNSEDYPYLFLNSLSSIKAQYGNNTITQAYDVILGGANNQINGAGSSILNGETNIVDGDFSSILGGYNNKLSSTADYSVILGGYNNLGQHIGTYIIGNNITTHSNYFAYVNNLSSTNDIYTGGRFLSGGKDLLNIIKPSLDIALEVYTAVKNTSADWNSVYSYVRSTSTLELNSRTFVNNNSANILEVNSKVNTTSANWNSVYSYTNNISARELEVKTFVGNNSANLIQVNTKVNTTSANWDSVYSYTNNISSRELEARTFVNNNSANIIQVNTKVNTTSSNWDSNYSHYNTNSATYAPFTFVNSKFLPTTGGIVTGDTQFNSKVTIYGVLSAMGGTYFANTIYSTTSALCVMNFGNVGPALYISNNGTGDIASFYDYDQNIEILHVGGSNSVNPNVGVKTSTPNADFTVKGTISASNDIYTSGRFLSGGQDILTIISPNVNLGIETYSNIKSLTGNWNSVYSYTNNNSARELEVRTFVGNSSANILQVNTKVNTTSSNWDSVYTYTNLNSANWNSVYSYANSNTGNWNSVYSFTNLNSSNWNSVYSYTNNNSSKELEVRTFVGNNSSNILNVNSTVINTSANWNSVYSFYNLNSSLNSSSNTFVNNNSANILEVNSRVNNTSANWNSVYSFTNLNSSNWNSVYSYTNITSTNLNSVYSFTNLNSSNWNSVYSYTNNNSSRELEVRTFVGNNSSNIINVNSTVNSTSSNWNSVYSFYNLNSSLNSSSNTFLNSNSANILEVNSIVNTTSANWNSVYSFYNSNSSNFYNSSTITNNNSANWNSVYSNVNLISSNLYNSINSITNNLSSNWQNTYSTVQGNSGNWESTYTTFKNSSANFITGSTGNYLPLSGGIINGNLSVTGTISSSKTVYSQEFYYDSTERPDLTGVKQALDELLYTAPAFNSLTVSGGNSLEVGQSLNTPSISWSTNKTFTSITLTFPNGSTSNGNGSFLSSSDPSSYSYTSSTGSKTWSVQGSDWKAATASRSSTVSWYYKIYMGAFNTTTPSSSDVLNNLQHSALATGRTALGSRSVTLSNQYFYVAYPAAFGTTSQLKVNGLNFTDLASVYTINPFTNASGGTASYYVYRTNNKLTGTYTMEVL